MPLVFWLPKVSVQNKDHFSTLFETGTFACKNLGQYFYDKYLLIYKKRKHRQAQELDAEQSHSGECRSASHTLPLLHPLISNIEHSSYLAHSVNIFFCWHYKVNSWNIWNSIPIWMQKSERKKKNTSQTCCFSDLCKIRRVKEIIYSYRHM